jgi:hypothetical protein
MQHGLRVKHALFITQHGLTMFYSLCSMGSVCSIHHAAWVEHVQHVLLIDAAWVEHVLFTMQHGLLVEHTLFITQHGLTVFYSLCSMDSVCSIHHAAWVEHVQFIMQHGLNML